MRTIPFLVLLCAAACGTDPTPTEFTDGGEDVPAESGRTYTWNFDADAPGELPDDFIRVLGDWRVNDGALAQLGEFEDVPESNLRFYRVVDGDRQQLASVDLDWSTGDGTSSR